MHGAHSIAVLVPIIGDIMQFLCYFDNRSFQNVPGEVVSWAPHAYCLLARVAESVPPLVFCCPSQAAQARLDALENDNDAGDLLAGLWET